MNTYENFDDHWHFVKQPIETKTEQIWTDKTLPWAAVQLPHDWLITDTRNLYETSSGFYRKTFYLPENKTLRTFICFDGVYMNSSFYVNRHHVGDWKFGYTAFEFDITDYLTTGENEIAVHVRYESPSDRWYTGAGIYRHVHLKQVPADFYIPSHGVYIGTDRINADKWLVSASTAVIKAPAFADVYHRTQLRLILSYQDEVILETDKRYFEVLNPKLWDLENPHLYTLTVQLYDYQNPEQPTHIQTERVTFGFREFSVHPTQGFSLNGQSFKLQGVCQHHDLGALGAAFHVDALRRQLLLLKEMGVNAIRTAHNPPAKAFMELTDELGFLVVSEIFDMWERPKIPYDYARFFAEWHEKDVTSWIKRDRNHPSLIMWSIGNEVYDTHADAEQGKALIQKLTTLVEEHEPFKNGLITFGSNYLPWENTQACADLIKLVGYNYGEYLYQDHHAKYPDWIIYGSETGSVVQSRGIYHFPLAQSVLADDDLQCSSLGNSATSWGAKSTQHCILNDRDTPFSLGQFIWTGTDYLGEPTPYHTKNSYFGQIDTAGFKKDAFYLYQSAWTSYKDRPMIHLFPYWDFSEGQTIDVQVASNTPKIELFFNDQSVGITEIDHEKGACLVPAFQLPYAQGVLKAVGYDENGQIIATAMTQSFGDVTTLQLTYQTFNTLTFVEIQGVDSHGIPVANGNNRVILDVTDGRLVGVDNGDSTDYDPFTGNSKRLFSGKLLAIIAHAQGVVPALTADLDPTDVPIRKIELMAERTHLDASDSTVKIYPKLHPHNATYSDLTWRVTDAAGIDSNLATLTIHPDHVVLTAKGDGTVYLRCSTHNGRDHINLISYLDFTLTGLGQVYLDPYQFVAGGLYNASNKPMTNGNDRGVATLREGYSHVGFSGVDFGPVGADTLTLPIFAMSQEAFSFEIWEGMPESGGEKLGTYTYDLGSQWNVYQSATYTLPRRLTGVTTLCFVVQKKIHLKGFIFEALDRAFEEIQAIHCDEIYGDQFTRTAEAIVGIGNNVTLTFHHMDFSKKKPTAIAICGSTPLDQNTISLKFDDQAATTLLDFQQSLTDTVQTFSLSDISCEKQVSFIFLPGSSFSFKWFKFICT